MAVHRGPQAGRYESVTAYTDQEEVAPLAAPDSMFAVGSAFPAV